ncbi:replication initiator protein A [Enterococcus diestrammenae]|uniref:Replication initiator A N-terminal domain-containing protein n=1 Tax=Enterococcus diestrammenae TaxID=1155073 RepID=A0ABV0F5Z1_9ENTE|nr:replication initiator protein A [Enterococcus diestrammenae]KAF1295289.1 hypothetical protein BAU18_10835 [Enterococcus diestrammenae]
MAANEFIPYQKYDVQEMTFIKFHKIFDKYQRFREMSVESILLYGFLVDRLSYFEQRDELLTDKDDVPFVLMSEEEMAFHARCSVRKVAKLKNELSTNGLIKQKRLSWNSINRPSGMYVQFDKQPNAIYVGHIQVFPWDKEVEYRFENDGMKKTSKLKANGEIKKEKQEAVLSMLLNPSEQNKALKSPTGSLSAKSAVKAFPSDRLSANFADKGQEPSSPSLSLPANFADKDEASGTNLSAKFADSTNHYNLNDSFNDTINDTSKESSESNVVEISEIEKTEFIEHYNRSFLTKQSVESLLIFGNVNQSKQMLDAIFESKRQVENFRIAEDRKLNLSKVNVGKFSIDGDLFSNELQKEIQKLIFQMKLKNAADNSITNIFGYFRKCMLTFWENCLLNTDFYGVDIYDDETFEFQDFLYGQTFQTRQKRYAYIYGAERAYFHGLPFEEYQAAMTGKE